MHKEVDLSTCRRITLDRRGDVVTYIKRLLDLSEEGKLPVLEELQVATDNHVEQRLVYFARYVIQPALCHFSELVCRTANSIHFQALKLPSLRKLVMLNLFLPVIAQGLETVELRRTTFSAIAPVPVLATVIVKLLKPSAGTLKHLHLHRAVKYLPTSTTNEVVSFPNLKSLCISGSLYVVHRILRSLKLSDSVRMDLDVTLEDGQGEAWAVQKTVEFLDLIGMLYQLQIDLSHTSQERERNIFLTLCACVTGTTRLARIKTNGAFCRAVSICGRTSCHTAITALCAGVSRTCPSLKRD